MESIRMEPGPSIPIIDCRKYSSVKTEHRHNYNQLVLSHTGRMEIEIAGKPGIIDRNQGAFVGENVRHEFSSSNDGTFVVLDVSASQLISAYYSPEIYDCLGKQLFFPVTEQMRCLTAYAVARGVTIDQSMISKSWATLIISEITDGTKSHLAPKARIIHKVIEFIDSNFCKKITIASIAKDVGVSERSLHALFVENLNTTPHAYIIKKRIEYAMLLLGSTHKSLPEIAFLSGYVDQSALSRGMQKLHGITPAIYRQKMRQRWPGTNLKAERHTVGE